MVSRFSAWLLLLVVPAFLFAGTVGKIMGVATDKEDGKPLMGVNIVVKGTTMGAATDADGRYYIFNVPPGIYDIEASYIGYSKMTIRNIRVAADLTTDVDFALARETIVGQEVVVIAERPIIEKSATNERRVVRSEDIENLPVRSAQDVVALQTGVVKVGGILYVRGGRTEEVAYYVDGVYQMNDYNRNTRPQSAEISGAALEEVSYQAGGFDAEYGNATSGIVSMNTKIGGNRFQISGEVVTDEFLSETKPTLGTYSYGYNLYNLSVGGPVLTNKIRFYANIERQFLRDRRTSVGSHPVGIWQGDKDGDGLKDMNEFTWKAERGPLPYNQSSCWLGAGNLMFDFTPFKIKIGGNFNSDNFRNYDNTNAIFCPEANALWRIRTHAYYARLTWTINPKTLANVQVSRFFDSYETMDPRYGTNFLKYGMRELPLSKYEEIYGGSVRDTSKYSWYTKDNEIWLVVNPYLPQNGSNPIARREYAGFTPPGANYMDYQKNEFSYIGGTGDIKTQVGFHELRAGFEYRDHTIRYYRIGAVERLARAYVANPPYSTTVFDSLKNIVGDPTLRNYNNYNDYLDAYWFMNYKNAYAENMGFTIDGKDYIDADISENRDAPRTPLVAGIYLNDKIEMKDLILNLGLRYDYINPNNLSFYDPAQIVLDSLQQIAYNIYKDDKGKYTSPMPTPSDSIGRKQMVESKKYSILSPRLGLAFPVTDQTVFHAQYGKYVQQPELNRMFVSFLRFAANLGQGNFTITGNPDLEPVKTTAYEIGFKQQLGNNASIDMTTFYKQLTGYIQVRNVAGAQPVVYATYVNGDYGTVKGLSFSFQLRRTGYVQAAVNYTLQYASGTGSTATSQYRIAWQGGNYPTYVAPLDFDQRHTGSVNVDFRTTEKDKIGRAGLNLLLTFGSGRRYTPTQKTSSVFPAISDRPIAALNSGTMPFVYQIDLKADKSIRVGKTDFTFYVWIQNLLNTKNVRNVYSGTGMPDYDGWFDTQEGKAWASNPNNSVALYNLRMKSPYNYETPRTIKVGVKFDIGR